MNDPFATSNPTTFADTPNATSSPESASGHTHSGSPAGLTTVASGPEAAPASPSVPPAKEKERQTSATCGRSGSISSASAALTQSLVNRLKRRFGTDGSILFKLTWKVKDTPSLRSVSLLRASGRRISDSDCGSSQTLPKAAWPTPQTMDTLPPMDYERRLNHPSRPGRKVSGNLREVVTLASWPTPKTSDNKGNCYEPQEDCRRTELRKAVALAGPRPCRFTSISRFASRFATTALATR